MDIHLKLSLQAGDFTIGVSPTVERLVLLFLRNQTAAPPIDERLDQILDAVAGVRTSLSTFSEKAIQMSDKTQASIDALIADNAQLQADVTAAPASIAALIATAIAGMASNGVTPSQMTQLTDLHTALGGAHTQLAAALAGTPPVIPPAAPASGNFGTSSGPAGSL